MACVQVTICSWETCQTLVYFYSDDLRLKIALTIIGKVCGFIWWPILQTILLLLKYTAIVKPYTWQASITKFCDHTLSYNALLGNLKWRYPHFFFKLKDMFWFWLCFATATIEMYFRSRLICVLYWKFNLINLIFCQPGKVHMNRVPHNFFPQIYLRWNMICCLRVTSLI